MTKKVADQLVESLVESGVKRIYAITGDSMNEINEAVRKNGKLKWVHVRHEEVGAYAAGAEAQLTGKLGCCAGSSGPGHVHLINGLYDAHRSGAPVVAIASTMPSVEMGMDYFQETNTIKLFDDCSYYNEMATTSQQFPRMLHSTMQTAISRNGVAVIGIPYDLAKATATNADLVVPSYPNHPTIIPSKEELQQLADILNSSDRVTLYCGAGCRDAHKEMVEFSQMLNAPVAYTFKSKMHIQYDNPNEVGLTGLLGMPSGYFSMHEADVLVMLGTDFPYSAFLPNDVKTVQIDIKPERLGRRTKLEMGLCGDIQSTLTALMPLINKKTDRSFLDKQLKRYAGVKKSLSEYINNSGQTDLIHPEYVMSVVNKAASDNAVFTVDTGMTCVWAARYLEATKDRALLGSFNHGSMACALALSIGAAFACPDKQIVALCGDGGLSMLLGDLATVVQYRLPIKVIVFNNRALGMVKLEMEVDGLADNETDMLDPDFTKIGEAMGFTSFTAHNPGEVEDVIESALKVDGPALVTIYTDPNALAMPPVVGIDQMVGFTKSMYKLMTIGRSEEVIDTIKSNYRHINEVL